ncbi:DUF2868 domain-containing protein [bacterium SCSIO 12696]|nr:DUF2868 domain-containing protein [bacterium SCSIO 12696]
MEWLQFRHALTQPKWQEWVEQPHEPTPSDTEAALRQFQKDTSSIQNASHSGLVIALLVSAIAGCLAMAGACSYSGNAPINLWLMLGLFALLPFALTLLTLWGLRRALRPDAPIAVVGQLALRPLLKRLPQQHLQSPVFKHWLLWKLQRLSLAFQVGAVVCFLIMALFQDLAFAWSSTVAERGTQAEKLVENFLVHLSWPWQWLLGAPSQELLSSSRFYRGGAEQSASFNGELLGQWWSYLVMAMVTYGLLPRLMLALWLRYRLAKTLLNEMRHSGDIERFALTLEPNLASTSDAANIESKLLSDVDSWQSDAICLAWQWQPKQIQSTKVLGLSSWQEDNQWLANIAPQWNASVQLLVTPQQVPTAELADTIEVIRTKNPKLDISLWLLSGPEKAAEGARKSWQLFARKYQLPFGERVEGGQ